MPAILRRVVGHDHQVSGSGEDLMVAPGAAVALDRLVRLDGAHCHALGRVGLIEILRGGALVVGG